MLAFALSAHAVAQQPSAGELLRDISQLQIAGSVLYVAAHPDDENTRLISWLSSIKGLHTTYLSMTRGGGGQNLIGKEQAELLGVVRTGELLAARAIDGGDQRFTRMRDFGYSKSAEETLQLWGHDEALADVVRAIRELRPDVVVARFGTEGGGHGHHTASALLASEAFEKAGDPSYPTEGLQPWKPALLFHNRAPWRLEEGVDRTGWIELDVGTYDPGTGRSMGEVAAASRTMHKSQGFGSSPRVGPQVELLQPLAGTPSGDPFEGPHLTLARFEGTGPLLKALQRAAKRFDPQAPHASLPHLARAHALMQTLPDEAWRARKTAEIERLMAAAAGLWLTARTEATATVPGTEVEVTLSALVRGGGSVAIRGAHVEILGSERYTPPPSNGPLRTGLPWELVATVPVPATAPLTRPHWLAEPPSPTRYSIADPAQHIAADTPPSLQAVFDVEIAGRRMSLRRPVEHSRTDRTRGEVRQPLEILPLVTATLEHPAQLLVVDQPTPVTVTLDLHGEAATGTLQLTTPDGIDAEPSEVPFTLGPDGRQLRVPVSLTATASAQPGALTATVVCDGAPSSLQRTVIDHAHLPRRTVLAPAQMALRPVALDRGSTQRIGYVPGSGDTVGEVLQSVGYDVQWLDAAQLEAGDLDAYDAIVFGIRAFNTRPELHTHHPQLMAYVQGGGRVLVQYNTSNRWRVLDGPIGPWPFAIDRGRVTREDAPLTPVDPEHPALLAPNTLTPADFDGWVQERGLYFVATHDERYETLFTAHDPGEEPLTGSVIVGRHGQGVFVYTGLSFFRQLPAGVPGATRLLANLLALP